MTLDALTVGKRDLTVMTEDTLTLQPWGRRWSLLKVELPEGTQLTEAAQHYLMGLMDSYLRTVHPRARWAGVSTHQLDILVRATDAKRFRYQLRRAIKQFIVTNALVAEKAARRI